MSPEATPAGMKMATLAPMSKNRDANQGHSLLRAALRRDIRGYERRSGQTVLVMVVRIQAEVQRSVYHPICAGTGRKGLRACR